MDNQTKRQILVDRITRIVEHIEFNGASEGIERELQKAKSELREIEPSNDLAAVR